MAKKMEVQARQEQSPAELERVAPVQTVPFDADIYERDDALVVIADLPGCDERSVDIGVEQGVLTIEGRVEPDNEKDYRLEVAEYRPCHFRRSFTLSNEVDVASIQASMRDGVLRLVLPKAPEARTRKIEVKTG